MTRGEITEQILTALGDSPTAPIFWSEAEIHDTIHEAQEVLAESVGGVKRTALVALTAGSNFYPLRAVAPDLLRLQRVYLASHHRRLTAVSRKQLDTFHETWRTVTGVPEAYLSMGYDWICVWPTPAVSGDILRIDYTAWPRELESDSDWPEFLEADHDTLVTYGLYDGLLKRWDVSQATPVWQEVLGRTGKGQARSGVNKAQARSWGRSSQPGVSFRSNVRDWT